MVSRILRSGRGPEILAALFGLGWFALLGGLAVVDPTQLDWLGHGDLSSQLVAWLLYRNSPWQLPLGRIGGLIYPVGSTAAMADLIPLLAVPARLLSPFLPVDFQYIGLWLATCFVLQGWFGARLVARLSDQSLHRLAGGMLFVLAPPLLARAIGIHSTHPSLCAQWLLVALLGLALDRPSAPRAAIRGAAHAGALLLLALWIHPMIAAMALAIDVVVLVRWAFDRILPVRALVAILAATAASLFGSAWLLGYLAGGAGAPFGGFGFFSADLLAFLNPMGFSRVLPALPARAGQYEGFAYAGLGVLALAAVALLLGLRSRVWLRSCRRHLGLGALCVGLALFALTPYVTLGGKPVMTFPWLMAHMTWIAGVFRAPGRFVWPLHYLLLAAVLAAVIRGLASNPRLASAILLGSVAIQILDLSGSFASVTFARRAWRLSAPEWSLAAGHYRHLDLVPPQVPMPEVGEECNGPYAWSYWTPLAYQAYRLGATINSGFVARVDTQAVRRSCRDLAAALRSGHLRGDTLYVVHPALRAAVERAGLVCRVLERHLVCVARSAHNPFVRWVSASGG